MSVLAALAALTLPATDAQAQGCVSDSQCQSGISSANTCVGDTLVMRRRMCVSGQCVQQDAGRMTCPPGTRCDGLAGTCSPAGMASPFPRGSGTTSGCPVTCSCKGRTLTIGTGLRLASGACAVTSFNCREGCACTPQARCLEDPTLTPNARRSAAARAAALDSPRARAAAAAVRASRSRASGLPPRLAEPFGAGPSRAAPARTLRPKTKKKRSARGWRYQR